MLELSLMNEADQDEGASAEGTNLQSHITVGSFHFENVTRSPQIAARVERVCSWLSKRWPHSEFVEGFENRLFFRLPKLDVPSLAKAFAILEAERDSVGLQEYSFGELTFEQIFIELMRRGRAESDSSTRPFFQHSSLHVVSSAQMDPTAMDSACSSTSDP